jgi:two-component system phosphate regulon sensor histidine kinase PhoR
MSRTLVGGSLAVGLGVVAVVLVVEASQLPHFWAPLAGAAMAAVITFVVIRLAIVPRLQRVDEALHKIERLVGQKQPASPEIPVPTNGLEVGELVGRLEQTALHVEERLGRLKRIESYRQEFLGDVSHELQTPIFAVQGFAETLLSGALEDETVNRAFIEKILRHSRRLSTLVNDLSHISQIETGSLKMILEPFDPNALLTDVTESMEMTAEAREIELLTFVTQDIPFAIGDRMRLRQVLDNLISNGIKYNEPGGRVEVTVREGDEGKIVFAVTDDGIGLAPEYFPRVTERFFRVDKSRSRKRGGTGLGLAIVKHILEAHGARLSIHSRPGHGSTFSFELDAATIDSAIGAESVRTQV